MRPIVRFAIGSIVVGIGVLTLKLVAARVSGSAALFSDALESVVNVAASLLALYALIAGAKPPDREHPYGHAKVELLSAVATGALILVAAGMICQRSYGALWHVAPLAPLAGRLGYGLALNALAGMFNAAWAVVLRRVGQRTKSPALLADSRHLLSDVISTLGIVAGLGVAVLLGLPIADPLIAILVAVQIAFMGGRTVLQSLSGLLDEAPPPAMMQRIQNLVSQHGAGALEAHDFRTRQAGSASFLEFHLVVPGRMTVAEAHAICDRIEAALGDEISGVVTTIHVEPEVKAKHENVVGISGAPEDDAAR